MKIEQKHVAFQKQALVRRRIFLSMILFALFVSINNIYAQDSFSTVPAIVENKGQLRNSNNAPADEIKYYSNAGSELFFWNKNFDLVISSYEFDSTNLLPLKLFRTDLKFINKDSNVIYFLPERDHYINYYFDSSRGSYEDIGVYNYVQVNKLYNNINLKYNVSESCNFLFSCFPGSDPKQIKFSISGSTSFELSKKEELIMETPLGKIFFNDLQSYQIVNNKKVFIDIKWNFIDSVFSFNFATYDRSLPLYIYLGESPRKVASALIDGYQNYWTTVLGGNVTENIVSSRLSISNQLYVCGEATNTVFPVIIGSLFSVYPLGGYDAFVVKFNPNRSVAWGAYYGGSGPDQAYLLENDVSQNSNVIIVGVTKSNTLFSCLTCPGYKQTINGISDIFIVKLNNSGYLSPIDNGMSTFFGGAGTEIPAGIAIGSNGSFFISGSASADSYLNFPYRNLPGSYFQKIYKNLNTRSKTNYNDGFISMFNLTNTLEWSTAVGGYDNPSILENQEIIGGLCVDSQFNLFATGYTTNIGKKEYFGIASINNSGFFPIVQSNSQQFSRLNSGKFDAVVLKFSPSKSLIWSTEFGGSEDDNKFSGLPSTSNLIAINDSNELFIAGITRSIINSANAPDFPIIQFNGGGGYNQNALNKNGMAGQDGFVAKFSNNNNTLIWSTYLGGNSDDNITGICCRNTEKVFVTGYTRSTDLPIKSYPGWFIQNNLNGTIDGFLLSLNNHNLNYLYSTYLGGDLTTFPYSIDCRKETVGNYTEEIILAGTMNYFVNFPFVNPTGLKDFFLTGNHSFGNGFITNFRLNCNSCNRIGNYPNRNQEFQVLTTSEGYEINLPSGTTYTTYRIYDLMGKLLFIDYINLHEEKIIINSNLLKQSLKIITFYDEIGKQRSIKLPIH